MSASMTQRYHMKIKRQLSRIFAAVLYHRLYYVVNRQQLDIEGEWSIKKNHVLESYEIVLVHYIYTKKNQM